MCRKLRLSAVLLASLLVLAVPIVAQESGTIVGVVTQVDGSPVSGASVTVAALGRGGLTGADGRYTIASVPAGEHIVTVRSIGLAAASQRVRVPAGGTVTANFVVEVDALGLEGIVVTGSATPVVKLESTVAVTTQTAADIVEKAPQSTAELLEVVPGFYVEASGGEGGNNVWARGIPQDGSFRYVAFQEDGLPVYESPELAFANIDLFYRVDETVERLEAVRGGTAAIFASNAPGGIINFVSKTGGDELEGLAKITVGDYKMFRVDVDYGGPIAEDWRFNIGGFYRTDSGIRDPGFPANRGGQLKANVTRLTDNGYVRISGRYLNDRNIFYLPVPLQNPDDPEGIPGFDPNSGTLTSIDAGRVKIPTPDNDVFTRDLEDGMHPVVGSLTLEGLFELGDGWTLKNSARAMNADIRFNAIFSVNNPETAEAFADERVTDLGGTGFEYTFTHDPDATFNVANQNGNGLVVQSGWWSIGKQLRMFDNDLRITKSWDDLSSVVSNAITGGVYVSDFAADEVWNFNNILQEVRDEPRLLDLMVTGTPSGDISVTDEGFTRYGDFYRNANNNGRLIALYLQDELHATEALRIDAGLRYETADFDGNVEQFEEFDLGDPTTTADDAVNWGNGDFQPYSFEFDDIAYSIGANYLLTDRFAAFGRVSDGFRMRDFDNWAGQQGVISSGETEDVLQVEGGVKYGSPNLGVFASVFYSELTDIPFVDEVLDPVTNELVRLARFGDAQTLGLETELVARYEGARLDVTATLQDPELSALRFEDPALADLFSDFDFSGNQIRRVPNVILSFKPSYDFGPAANNFKVFANIHYIDERFVDDANQVTLPSYTKVDAGLRFDVSDRVTVTAHGDNLGNTIGLTEGNPRVGQVVGSTQDIYMARPILGRAFRFAVGYTF